MTSIWITIVIGFLLSEVVNTTSPTYRIVGGNSTTIEEYPSIVQVEFLSQITNVWSHNCGGNILTSMYVLSAAQCFSGWNSDAPYRRIRAGATYRHIGGTIVYVMEAFNHPSYGFNGMDGDIAVVRLSQPLVYSPTIQQGIIVENSAVVPDKMGVVLAGWGRIREGGPYSEVLRDVTVYTVNRQLCAQRYAQLSPPLIITNNMICAGHLDVGGRDACHDDCGGPMYVGDVIIGIISGGNGCANGTWPGINTAVASYTNWIVSTATAV